MKKSLLTIIILLLLIPSTVKATPADLNNIYPQTFIVSDIDKANDIVYLETPSGMIYTWQGVEDWMIGDIASAIMNNNKTHQNITDDKIIKLQYAGYWGF